MSAAAYFAPYQQIAETLLGTLETGDADAAHDLSHLLRVWQNVRQICVVEGGNLALLVAATLMHDCVLVAKDAPHRALASRKAADQAERVLTNIGWPAKDVRAVAHAIEAHSFSANVTPKTLEARILQDADRLDALGYVGIARCFAVSGTLDRPLYDLHDPAAQMRSLDDASFAIDHFSTKLIGLADSFQTPTGREMAMHRQKVLKDFLSGFLREVAPAPEYSPLSPAPKRK